MRDPREVEVVVVEVVIVGDPLKADDLTQVACVGPVVTWRPRGNLSGNAFDVRVSQHCPQVGVELPQEPQARVILMRRQILH